MDNSVRVASQKELRPGRCKVVRAQGRDIALYNVAGDIYATDNMCPHQGGPLGEGTLSGKIVTCPWHAWTYDVTTGICPMNPNNAIRTLPVTVENSDIYVVLDGLD